LWIETVFTFHRALPKRPAVVADVAAAFGLLARANLLSSTPPIARVDKALAVHGPMAPHAARNPVALAGQ
jgi:hypothetical protein